MHVTGWATAWGYGRSVQQRLSLSRGEWSHRPRGLSVGPAGQVVDTFFAVFFMSEVAVRATVLRCQFWGVGMNYLDLLVPLARGWADG